MMPRIFVVQYVCRPDLRSMHPSGPAAPALHQPCRSTTVARTVRPGRPPCGLSMCARHAMDSVCGAGTQPTGITPRARSRVSPRQSHRCSSRPWPFRARSIAPATRPSWTTRTRESPKAPLVTTRRQSQAPSAVQLFGRAAADYGYILPFIHGSAEWRYNGHLPTWHHFHCGSTGMSPPASGFDAATFPSIVGVLPACSQAYRLRLRSVRRVKGFWDDRARFRPPARSRRPRSHGRLGVHPAFQFSDGVIANQSPPRPWRLDVQCRLRSAPQARPSRRRGHGVSTYNTALTPGQSVLKGENTTGLAVEADFTS